MQWYALNDFNFVRVLLHFIQYYSISSTSKSSSPVGLGTGVGLSNFFLGYSIVLVVDPLWCPGLGITFSDYGKKCEDVSGDFILGEFKVELLYDLSYVLIFMLLFSNEFMISLDGVASVYSILFSQ